MPNDTAFHREHAARCERFARETDSESLRDAYLDLAARWRKLAADIDGAEKREQSQPKELKVGPAP